MVRLPAGPVRASHALDASHLRGAPDRPSHSRRAPDRPGGQYNACGEGAKGTGPAASRLIPRPAKRRQQRPGPRGQPAVRGGRRSTAGETLDMAEPRQGQVLAATGRAAQAEACGSEWSPFGRPARRRPLQERPRRVVAVCSGGGGSATGRGISVLLHDLPPAPEMSRAR
jgi:hypothetical protein